MCLVHFDPNELSHFGKQGLLKLGGFRNNLRILVRVVFTGFAKNLRAALQNYLAIYRRFYNKI